MGVAGRHWVRWSNSKRAAFLDHLAATCNVKAAAEAAKLPVRSMYALRRRDAEFAGKWDEAVAQGVGMLETHLVALALTGERAIATGLDGTMAEIDKDLALRLLAAHQKRAETRPRRGGPGRRRMTPEEIEAALTAKIDAVVKARTGAA